ncbi:hypothetical protein RC13_06395 [Campylobacter jejuni]|uniref:DUF2972 domain-containing protein n=1 Tax=Campylobacter jejuni TaxID=197 RepID=UPI00073DBC2E|nr:DUF2972 domain-containing protein [Campylobacter jejuni]ALW05158.1 hypothetical protein RC13_06395 [Campylobacter jejuni]
MHNPNSAIERVKNHLAYKLGQAMIDFTNSSSGGGYIALFKKLYKIKKQHKKEQKIYQQTIQVFPQLKYPSLEACSDYEQALRYKFHLSYMLGEVLIKAYQTWYTGGGFKLKNNIKKANKEFQIFREIFKEYDQINSSILEGLIDNKQLFLKEFSRIKNILKIHQDYKAILDNIFHNFNYFIQNFDLIEEWLLSDDFKERYKKENHPYPSLLDPKKLNDKNEKINYHNIPAELAWEMNLPLPDNYEFVWLNFDLIEEWLLSDDFKERYKKENHPYPSLLDPKKLNDKNEKINYHNIPAELAWEMNLPLPDNYEFVWLGGHAMGCAALNLFFQRCNVNVKWCGYLNGFDRFVFNYHLLVSNSSSYNALQIFEYRTFTNKFEEEKFFSSFSSKKKILISYKDPFTMIKTILNANIVKSEYYIQDKKLNASNITKNTIDILQRYKRKYNKYNIKDFDPYLLQHQMLIQEFLLKYFKNSKKYFLDMNDIQPENAFITLEKLATYFNFTKPSILDKQFYQEKKSLATTFLLHYFPLILDFDEFEIEINAKELNYSKKDDISDLFFKKKIYIDNHQIHFYINKNLDFDKKLYIKIKKIILQLIYIIKKYINLNQPLCEKDILHYLSLDKKYRDIYLKIINYNLTTLKQHRPDIVASWKYYQEFEKMCKELDG